jgi:hypothetical protein
MDEHIPNFSSMGIDKLRYCEEQYSRNRTPEYPESAYWRALQAELRQRTESVDRFVDKCRPTPLAR